MYDVRRFRASSGGFGRFLVVSGGFVLSVCAMSKTNIVKGEYEQVLGVVCGRVRIPHLACCGGRFRAVSGGFVLSMCA
jgi:hypothetical protein